MSPNEIYNTFVSRVGNTNLLFGLLNEDSPIELSNVVYFKYYFDLSTSIEATIRGISYEESKKSEYLKYLAIPNSDSKAFFLKYDEFKALVDIDLTYTLLDISYFNNNYISKIDVFDKLALAHQLKKDGSLQDKYNTIRNTRNSLAHGIKSTSTVAFDKETLETFVFIFYFLLSYYKHLYSKDSDHES